MRAGTMTMEDDTHLILRILEDDDGERPNFPHCSANLGNFRGGLGGAVQYPECPVLGIAIPKM